MSMGDEKEGDTYRVKQLSKKSIDPMSVSHSTIALSRRRKQVAYRNTFRCPRRSTSDLNNRSSAPLPHMREHGGRHVNHPEDIGLELPSEHFRSNSMN